MMVLAKITALLCLFCCCAIVASENSSSSETVKVTNAEAGTTTVVNNVTTSSVISDNTTNHHNGSSEITTPSDLDWNVTNTFTTTENPGDTNTTVSCPGLPQKLAVLPGQGWDNLESVVKGQIFMKNYSNCIMTTDGVLLIPDGMFPAPVFETTIDPNAEVFTNWDEYYPISAKSVTKDITNLDYASVTGSFSKDYQRLKKAIVTENAVTVRTKLEIKLYEIGVELKNIPFTADFTDAISKLAEALYSNDHSLVDYYADSLIGTYGTHLVNGIIAGGIAVIDDLVKADFLDVADVFDYSKLTTVAKVKYLQYFNLTSGNDIVDPLLIDMLAKYRNSTVDTQAVTYGGVPELPFSYNQWQKAVSSSPSTVDRTGILLDEVVTEDNFPSVPPPFVQQMKVEVKNAINRYYIRNTYRGCTKKEAPNFAFIANKEDGTCLIPATNYTFGGMYTECMQSPHRHTDLCLDLEHVNPLTGHMNCPEGYRSIPLHERTVYHFGHHEELTDVTYKIRWCAAIEELPQGTGYLFGGLYSSKAANMVTGRKDCPSSFTDLHVGQDLHVCVSSDSSPQVLDDAVPFGGFFSCVYGNPLVLPLDERRHSEGDDWPLRCPSDYSQQSATVDGVCSISYCISASHINTTVLPLVRPPYSDKPNATDTFTAVSVDENTGNIWYRKNASSSHWLKATTKQDLIDAGLEGLADLLPDGETNTTQKTTTVNHATGESVSGSTTNEKTTAGHHGTSESVFGSTTNEKTTAGHHGTTDAVPGNTTTVNDTSSNPGTKKDDRLSGGAIAGIVIVATLGVLAVVGLGGYAYKKNHDARERSGSRAHLTQNDSVQNENVQQTDPSVSQPQENPPPEESFDSPA